ncbi:MAG: hypothetical protein Q9162_003208 [Coniocarpon cinnabarinum]
MTETQSILQSSPAPNAGSSPEGSISTEDTSSNNGGAGGTPHPPPSFSSDATQQPNPSFPVKTDKPRPHVCTTCTRSFARLEHLKRHERSHTKEKPFECPECTRCFARRDLLLRHQQKLHMTTTPSSRPRGNRRESTSSISGSANRVRKNSTSSMGSAIGSHPRPRANTISHIEGGSLGMLSAANRSMGNVMGMEPPATPAGPGPFQPRGMSASARMHGNMHALPRLATHGHSMDMGGGLRTAPPGQPMGGFGFEQNFPFPQAAGNSTINPAQLHMGDPLGMMQNPLNGQQSPFTPQPPIMEDEGDMEWMHGFNTQMSFGGSNDPAFAEQAIADSPHPMPGNGHITGFGDVPFDQTHAHPGMQWPPAHPMNGVQSDAMAFHDGLGSGSGFDSLTQTINPGSLHPQVLPETIYENSALHLNGQSNLSGIPSHVGQQKAWSSDGTDGSSATGSQGRQSSVTSTSVDSITDTTRNALLLSLSQPSGLGPRKYSQPSVTSPLSAHAGPTLPSTHDLQRFVSAYIQYFHPHFPFIHVPTLSFDAASFTQTLQAAENASNEISYGGIMGGGGCLILGMAAIGACYEFEREAFKELFDALRKMITLYLNERTRAGSHTLNRQSTDLGSQSTPLWFVQAMLLNVVLGHQSEGQLPQNIASNSCVTLVELTKSAGLLEAISESEDVSMGEAPIFQDPFSNNTAIQPQFGDDAGHWYRWIDAEERKRTLFAIFHMSSLLVVAWNHPPALQNSGISQSLPCDELLWRAPTPQAWAARRRELGGSDGSMPFQDALRELLMANEKQDEFKPLSHGQPFGSGVAREDIPQSNMRPSTFGCLILIDALHNYIWETRQRHCGRAWTTQQTEAMHAHTEPALRAWQAAWQSTPEHRIERPNPFGHGPLSADSIPLLDLAYVRLFVNLGTSKEAMWQRDFQAMAEEIARGSEFIQHAENSGETSTDGVNTAIHSPVSESFPSESKPPRSAGSNEIPEPTQTQDSQSRKRERHLRKAASYAADSLIISDKLGITFTDFSARELPVQSAMCLFDCAQVLAEWISTVQERVGHYVGVLGRDPINLNDVPAIMLLDEEDGKLLGRVDEYLQRVEDKMSKEINSGTLSKEMLSETIAKLPSQSVEGYGSKILRVTTFILDRSLVWPDFKIEIARKGGMGY